MLGGADNPNGELLSYIIGADTFALVTDYVLKFAHVTLLYMMDEPLSFRVMAKCLSPQREIQSCYQYS
ncbi:hypothetical protein HRL93_004156 [Salmonella enterica]|nr:hypothetical protein [Salmonella enterica]EFV1749183.1 hypothetical protein [Salmonella enterica]